MACNVYRLTASAESDLDQALNYISKELHNPSAAQDLLEGVERIISYILAFPQGYPIVEYSNLRCKEVRRAFVKHYILFYTYDPIENAVIVLRFLYSGRDIEAEFRLA